MDNERVLIATDKKTLKEVLNEMFSQKSELKALPEFEQDRLSKKQAATLAGISIPTLSRMVAKGKFKEYSLGRRKYFLKSEIIESLRNYNF
ncbi:MAG: helix-turn-helix domain-containing protein [Ignavibacteria bacterium]|nr:helix-turn-helix domain-containing protein [Ignavibacteria bacterium]